MIRARMFFFMALIALLAGCATSSVDRQLGSIVATQREADDAYAHGDMQVALQRYETLIKAVPKESSYWFRLGNVQFRLMQLDAAIASYQQAITLKPGYTEAWYNLGIVRLRMAQIAFVRGSQQAPSNDPVAAQSAHFAEGIAALTDVEHDGQHSDGQHSNATAPAAPSPTPAGQGGATQ